MATSAQRSDSMLKDLHIDVGEGFLREVFGGKSFLHCLVELVKNARDYGASFFSIFTLPDRGILRVIDDGDGMAEENRCAFVSINRTTAKSKGQAGRFGTGTKQMLFSFAKSVMVRTAPKDDPEHVYLFEFTAEEYERLAFKEGKSVPQQRVAKTAQNWPHAHSFGTEITYVLLDPKNRSIFRGERLAKELSARLPVKFEDIVRVDDEPLPPKKIIGKRFESQETIQNLGTVVIELYRPETRHSDEDLRLASVEVGEIPLSNLMRVLPPEFRDRVPRVYLISGVCGTITVEFIGSFSNEDRNTLQPAAGHDPRTHQLIQLLRKLEPSVRRALDLKLEDASGDVGIQADIKEVTGLFGAVYPSVRGPSRLSTQEQPLASTGEEQVDAPPREQRAMWLEAPGEFEPGEPIEIKIRFSAELSKKYDAKQINWKLDRSRAKRIRLLPDGILLEATKDLGVGTVIADLPGTPYSCKVTYQIVQQRVFRLSASSPRVERGGSFILTAINADKLPEGKIAWSYSGRGLLEPMGGMARFRGTEIGSGIITAASPIRSEIHATCDVTIVNPTEWLFRIQEHAFRVESHLIGGGERADIARPAIMHRGGSDNVHTLHLNGAAPGYVRAHEQGVGTSYLLMQIAIEYFRFVQMDLPGIGEIDPRDFPHMMSRIAAQADALFANVIGSKKV